MKLPQPTRKNIEELANRLEERHRDAQNSIEYRRQIRYMDMPVSFGAADNGSPLGIPKGYRKITVERRSPRIQHEGQQAKALLLSNAPSLTVRPPRESDQEMASKVERFLLASYARLEEASHAHEKLVDTQVHYYMGILKTFPRRRPYPDMPLAPEDEDDVEAQIKWDKETEDWKKRQSLFEVFEYVVVPADTFYYLEDSRGELLCGMEIKRVPEVELLENYGLIKKGEGEYIKAGEGSQPDDSDYDPFNTVEMIEFWNRQWRVIIARQGSSSSEVDTWEHNFGIVPYFRFTAFQTSESQPHLQHIPLLWALYPEIEESNRLQTMRTAVAYQSAYPFWYVYTPPANQPVMDPNLGKPKAHRLEAGVANQLGSGQEYRQLELRSGFDLQAALVDSENKIAQFALPPIASGRAPSGESAGWNTAMLRRFLVSMLDPLVKGRAQATAAYMRFWLDSIKNHIGQDVYVNSEVIDEAGKVVAIKPIAVGPDDIKDYDIKVMIEPNLQNEKIAQEAHGASLVQQGLRSRLTFMEEDAGRDAPEEELRRIDVDRAEQVIWENVAMPQLLEWAQSFGGVQQVLQTGMTPEEVRASEDRVMSGLGTGSPGMMREPGVRMPPSLPAQGSPTFTPPEGM